MKSHLDAPKEKLFCFINSCERYYFSLETLKKHLQKTHRTEYNTLKEEYTNKNFNQIYNIIKTETSENKKINFLKFKDYKYIEENSKNLNHGIALNSYKNSYKEEDHNSSNSNYIDYSNDLKKIKLEKESNFFNKIDEKYNNSRKSSGFAIKDGINNVKINLKQNKEFEIQHIPKSNIINHMSLLENNISGKNTEKFSSKFLKKN